MPEGHTIHRIAHRLNGAFARAPVRVSSPQGRFAAGAAELDGRELVEAQAWGKHLGVEFAADRWLHVHLGLIGAFSVDGIASIAATGSIATTGSIAATGGIGGEAREPEDPPVTGQVRLRILSGGEPGVRHVADLRGPMICRLVTPEEIERTVARLGPDPLRPDADPELAWARIRRSGKPIAELLMDQHVLAGVGNVYRAEVLYRHRLSPFTPGDKLQRRSWNLIWDDLVRLLPLGVATSRIVTIPEQVAEVEAALAAGGEVHLESRASAVYKHAGEPCERDGARIQIRVLAGRNLFWCGRCQRRG
ncbi:Fpg/Nei family DNA glycosylase [Pseudactinotalea sp. HY158]|uniref:Fpg/Nei family DNA glycosylase n=1 Tax=Pseudactinotalea sp. HY158 TaxID=2654547 RepID=UPI00129C7B4A|nr:DNA-formamidopyrimidine glycosylase family protein [Pseudactinotalea sp. HY158]QGH70538.1 Fpg/Nei family DNA glycosylase [Pseudactinotalea sp. HY158]